MDSSGYVNGRLSCAILQSACWNLRRPPVLRGLLKPVFCRRSGIERPDGLILIRLRRGG